MIKNIRACNGTGVAQCVILAILLVLLSSMLIFVGLSTDNNIAYADSTNGIVEDNLLFNSSFENFDNWNNSNCTISSFSPLRFTANANWSSINQNLPSSAFYQTITIAIRFRVVTSGTAVCNIRYQLQGQSNTIGLDNNVTKTSSNTFVTTSYTYDLSSFSNLVRVAFVIYGQQANTIVEVEWAKVEIGSSFTGYVPKDYTNYGYDQGLIDFDYPIFQYVDVTTLNGGVGVNLDSSYMATNIVDQNASILRVYSLNNAQASYSPYVPCAFYYDFSNTIVNGSVILFDFNFNVQFNGTQRVYYKFAPLNTSLSSEDVNSYYDGYFDNNTTGLRLMCPIESTRIYFCVRVNQTSSFSGAGGLTYNYLYTCTREIGDTIYSSVLPLDTDYLSQAYNRGYINGKADGIVIGQNEQPYSFKGLFSAIYSVPINAFNNMFNFDVFGVNMRTFILGMITFALALFVWKIIVRGG